MRRDPGLLYNFSLALVGAIARPIGIINYESERSDKTKQAKNIGLSKLKTSGRPAISRRGNSLAARRPVSRHGSSIDEAAPPAFGKIALAAKQPGAMATPGSRG